MVYKNPKSLLNCETLYSQASYCTCLLHSVAHSNHYHSNPQGMAVLQGKAGPKQDQNSQRKLSPAAPCLVSGPMAVPVVSKHLSCFPQYKEEGFFFMIPISLTIRATLLSLSAPALSTTLKLVHVPFLTKPHAFYIFLFHFLLGFLTVKLANHSEQ